MRKWQPSLNLHYAVILNRDEVRKDILTIRAIRRGHAEGDETYWLKLLNYDWKQYRHFMAEREIERSAWLDSQTLIGEAK